MVGLGHYLGLSLVLFTIGVAGVLTRRNAIVIFMSIELMLNAANLALIAFSRFVYAGEGQALVFFGITVAAAEVAIGLAIIILVYRRRHTVNVDELTLLKG